MPSHVIYLIRHGSRFDYANPDMWKGLAASVPSVLATDPPLCDYGLKQANLCAEWVAEDLKNESCPPTIRSSLYWRVIQTAAPLLSLANAKLNLEPGLCEYGHVYNTLPTPVERMNYQPLINLEYKPLVTMDEVDWSNMREKEQGIDYLRRVQTFGDRVNGMVQNSPDDTVDVFYSHAASVSLIAYLLKQPLYEAGEFSPTGVFKLRRKIEGDSDTGWVLERHGSDNKMSLPVGEPEKGTKPWGFKADNTHGRDYKQMWEDAEFLNTRDKLYHICGKKEWEDADQYYVPNTYLQDGFTHLANFISELVMVGNLFYKDEPGEWVCLELDVGHLKGEVRLEPAAPVGDTKPQEGEKLYPHLYSNDKKSAGIRKDAVTRILNVRRGQDGEFLGVDE
ncbi:hypothetical protein TrST_g2487 [Triparma strigata]|uniref:Phosphoglycerate mutase-like protein n=1 Tax=Triparma strigata TaxID=1606541 RepID=A0A9W7AAQ7_9STRA|nr:hypothetical protein TrST_g2487 [Triparma strigata]